MVRHQAPSPHPNEISPKRRGSMGVRIFDVGADQKVVSVARLRDAEGDADNGEGDEGEEGDNGVEDAAEGAAKPETSEAEDNGAGSED